MIDITPQEQVPAIVSEYKKQEGQFSDIEKFISFQQAYDYSSLNGGMVIKNYDGSFLVIYIPRTYQGIANAMAEQWGKDVQ